jgi:hypothetical protein
LKFVDLVLQSAIQYYGVVELLANIYNYFKLQNFFLKKERFTFVFQLYIMIQRIQTLYLFTAAIFSGVLIFVFNLWVEKSGKVVSAIDLLNESSFLLKTILFAYIISALISLITIFLFKDRQLQFVLGRVNMLINFYLLGVLIYVLLTMSGETSVSEKGIGMFIPIIVIAVLALANKAIKKDEDLVKSVDRLR